MNDLEAALGISQLNRLKKFINKRNDIAKYYDNKLAKSSNTKTSIYKK